MISRLSFSFLMCVGVYMLLYFEIIMSIICLNNRVPKDVHVTIVFCVDSWSPEFLFSSFHFLLLFCKGDSEEIVTEFKV